ncbi:MAG: glycine cleavage system aminomethyltransferase GcvT [Parachlamydiaceae bacterium]|nr:glycine cleavage system aminomethyltransferase GcvT [Parachlamydiaceae bacterium]
MKTALYDRHCALGAKMVPFAGWEMPVQYKGVIAEHNAVREAVGLFDVSHMGRILVEGEDAETFLNTLSTNQIAGKDNGTATYTVWCHEEGGCVDDVIIYRKDSNHFFVIVNAGNRQKDLDHLLRFKASFKITIKDRFEEDGILSLQGPLAEGLLSQFYPEVKLIKPMHFLTVSDKGRDLVISRTGYTGAGGYELYASNDLIVEWWDRLLKEGMKFGIEPIGLGARDTLRLEMGFALYGHEINDTISPNESVANWTIKWEKEEFVGKTSIQKLETSPQKRHEYGIKLIERGIAREGYPVFQKEVQIGHVTSGTFSPTLNEAIAIIIVDVPLQIGDNIDVHIRQKPCQAQVVKIPFIRKSS